MHLRYPVFATVWTPQASGGGQLWAWLEKQCVRGRCNLGNLSQDRIAAMTSEAA